MHAFCSAADLARACSLCRACSIRWLMALWSLVRRMTAFLSSLTACTSMSARGKPCAGCVCARQQRSQRERWEGAACSSSSCERPISPPCQPGFHACLAGPVR